MNTNSKNGNRATHKTGTAGEPKKNPPKMGMISELRKGTKYIDPLTEEIVWVNYSDEDCKGVGPSNGFTTDYIRKGDEMWNKAVQLA